MSDRLKYERFLWFHSQVKAGKFPNAVNLAENFELSGRTAQRDIEFIRDHRLDAPLQYNHQHRGYCYTDDSYELPTLWINESNILALSLPVRLASTIPDQWSNLDREIIITAISIEKAPNDATRLRQYSVIQI